MPRGWEQGCGSQLIPQALGEASRSPGPHSMGNAGGSGSRAAREHPPTPISPPPPHPHWALIPLRLSKRFEAHSATGQTIFLIPNQVLEQLTMKSASPRATHGQRKILGTCPAVVYRLQPTSGRRYMGQLTGSTWARGAGGSCKLKMASAGQVWQTGTIRVATRAT